MYNSVTIASLARFLYDQGHVLDIGTIHDFDSESGVYQVQLRTYYQGKNLNLAASEMMRMPFIKDCQTRIISQLV